MPNWHFDREVEKECMDREAEEKLLVRKTEEKGLEGRFNSRVKS